MPITEIHGPKNPGDHICTTPRASQKNKMITRESQACLNMGRGAYDTTGVPKPPPKPKRR
ncbi:hypothetical protein CONLIGDRAFT_716405 [Coniochaeta ligniaria NRRL 30616]|uniref:Uncharacterized protein n=1 Tax=Coniochaeta ligniaria NRRL 30616 TaxID=1408157 RepID=A0A1J7IL68_9PEZI|nr:hypothetical protein CONLIGDRAFT_716405 [Coniochaeta ligniaria NRRL 30616]